MNDKRKERRKTLYNFMVYWNIKDVLSSILWYFTIICGFN